MPKKLFLLFSHTLTPEQQADAQASLGVSEFIPLPPDLQELFSNVPPDLPDLHDYLLPLYDWIGENIFYPDYALIQGDFGVVFSLVEFCKDFGYGIPVYATTERISMEATQPDGSVVTQRTFRHKMFREY
jgi:hypothetical protein